jgi:enoyl-CoA hydratase/carnithine racemase
VKAANKRHPRLGLVYESGLELRTAFGSVAARRIVEMAVTEHVKLERKDGLLVLTLANPDGNRIGLGVLAGLRAALVELERPETRAVLLKGEGPVFSYGADLKEFITRPPAELFALMQEYLDILGQFETSEKPTIAAVHGVCSSGGLELALAFDQIWAAAGTKIGFLEPNIATPPLAGGVQRIAARAGRARAFEVTTSGHFYEAEQFERWNIINRVLPFDTLLAEAETFATKWSTGPTRAYGGVKSLLRAWDRQGVAGADKVTIATVTPIIASDDAKTAIKVHGSRGENRVKLTFSGR